MTLALTGPAIAGAASFAGAVGYESYEGAGQVTRAALGVGVVKLEQGAEASLAVVRYDDNSVGPGSSLTLALGLPLETPLTLRSQGSRFFGDQSYRAWRAKVGPQWSFSGGASVWLAYAHFEDNQEFHLDGGALESATPLTTRLTAKLNASYAIGSQDLTSLQGSVGLGWVVVPHLELSGEVGLAQNGASVAASFATPLLPILGDPEPSSRRAPEDQVSSTALLGLRVFFP
ncbi:MAG TPA: hypothetical protein VGK93_03435 [Candidatus Eisenbacteria bacterium]